MKKLKVGMIKQFVHMAMRRHIRLADGKLNHVAASSLYLYPSQNNTYFSFLFPGPLPPRLKVMQKKKLMNHFSCPPTEIKPI